MICNTLELEMNPSATDSTVKRWTARELRKLPPVERDRILEAAAIDAEHEYSTNAALTDFEAFGKDDLYGDSANAQTR